MRLNFVKDNFSIVTTSCSLNFFCQRCQLVDWVRDFLRETENKRPDKQEKSNATRNNYSYQIFELLVDFFL